MKNGFVKLPNDLKGGEKVRLILPDESLLTEVTRSGENGFHVELDHSGPVFVYGREVHDFHVVDYEALSMLHLSATQELFRMVLEQKNEFEKLNVAYEQLSTELRDIRFDLERIERTGPQP